MADIYGKNFQEARLRVLERDGYRCRTCDHDGSDLRFTIGTTEMAQTQRTKTWLRYALLVMT